MSVDMELLSKACTNACIDKNMLSLYMLKTKEIETFLLKQDFNKIVIYGVGVVGRKLATHLLDSEIDIRYCIDRKRVKEDINVAIYDCWQEETEADAVIVTAEAYFGDIYEDLRKHTQLPIIRLSELLDEIMMLKDVI